MSNQIKVYVVGSRKVNKLPLDALNRINKIIDLKAKIWVGDSPVGADKLVQDYLKAVGYRDVIVWYIDPQQPRYNAGFQTHQPEFEYRTYRERDKYLSEVADFGLAIATPLKTEDYTLFNIKDYLQKYRVVYSFDAADDAWESISINWRRSQYRSGLNDGRCDYPNKNIGHAAPCPFYQYGYITGVHERLLQDIPQRDWGNWELVAEVQSAYYPLSSPATYKLVSLLPALV